MSVLLVEDSSAAPGATIGGKPLVSADFAWPRCRTCGGAMQFIAQLPMQGVPEVTGHQDQVLMIFQCQHQPGLCDEWDAVAGGNAALLMPLAGRQVAEIPAGETLLPQESRLRLVPYDGSLAKHTPDDAYCEALDSSHQRTLGKMGGVPLWIQGDETPTCACGQRMRFVAQLEDRGGGGINFGDAGSGYAFACVPCQASARFLWQCS